jgi:hypothetical protein
VNPLKREENREFLGRSVNDRPAAAFGLVMRRSIFSRVVSAPLAPLTSIRRDLRALTRNRAAFASGLFFALGASGGLFALLTSAPVSAEVPQSVPFDAGLMTPLGPIPRNVQVTPVSLLDAAGDPQATETADDSIEDPEALTTDEDAQVAVDPTPRPPRPRPPGNAGPKPVPPKPEPPSPPAPPVMVPPPPTADPDPFGATNGWAEMTKEGDPWATAVLAALNSMRIPTWAASGAHGAFSFRLRVCPSGRVDKVFTKRPSGDDRLDRAIVTELARTSLPPMSSTLREAANGRCATLRHTFVWTDARTR